MINVLSESLIDSLKLLPFLFFAFFIIELLEHKFNPYTEKIIKKAGNFGPFLGSLLGIFPQCGFSVMATNLYVTGIISIGTLISVYLSCSDEMLPLLLTYKVAPSTITKILLIKLIIATISGLIIDIIHKNKKNQTLNHEICNKEHCHCDKSLIKSTIKHTINIFIFIFIFNLLMSIILEYLDKDIYYNIFNKNNFFSPLLTSLIGLIPSCASSVIITELYLKNIIPISALISGLLTGSGLALVVLFKTNQNLKNSIKILILIYLIGSISGLVIQLIETII